MKNYIFYLLLIVSVVSCKNGVKQNKEDADQGDTTKVVAKVNVYDQEKDSLYHAKTDIQFLKALQYFVKNNDKEVISSVINYPIHTIPNKEFFFKHYDSIFNTAVKDSLQVANLDSLFRNYQGTMVGNGQIWVNEVDTIPTWKIIAINY
ncbi:MAG: hypothetical protein ACEPOV_10465 [Hyphomicrobiales bacterium]